jgi:peptide/nickel transport system permease protein
MDLSFLKIPSGRGRGFLLSGLIIVSLIILISLLADVLTPYSPVKEVAPGFIPPCWEHPFGTNKLGMDMFSRILYGGRTVLTVVISATLTSMIVGVTLGLVSGYTGGVLDRGLSFIMDSIYVFPSLILAIAITAVLGPNIINAIIAIGIIYIPTYFRMVRGQTLQIKSSLYVEAAKSIGASSLRIMRKYVLPNLLPTILVVFSMNAADAILTEAGLAFLGYSVPPPTPDWGFELQVGVEYILSGYWWLIFFPGVMVTLLAMGFALIGEGLTDILSPRGEG